MSNITTYNAMPASLTESMSIAKMFAESGMFSDTKTAAQALVKIQAGAEMGIPPFASMSGVHIIQGKPTVGAGLMASRVKASGKYDYRVIESTEKVCSVDFYQGKEKIGNSTFTFDDAKKAGTKNIDKFPKNMLFARAISNGVKFYCPDVFAGPVYVPEEMETIETTAVVIQQETSTQQATALQIEQITEMMKHAKESELMTDEELKPYWKGFKALSFADAQARIKDILNTIKIRENHQMSEARLMGEDVEVEA